jgi:long-chain acyl-CoA synthetase
MDTLLDLLDGAVERYADRPALRAYRDDGRLETWTYRDLGLRARAAAWRLRALGLARGERLLTWSPSSPELPAVYFGAMLAGLVLVPLDLRMAADAIERIVARAGARHLALGTGRDAPDPREVGLGHFPTTTVEALAAAPDDTFPPDWESTVAGWERPLADDLVDLIFTSGTTGQPKGVMLAHSTVLASIDAMHRVIPPLDHRVVSVLPLSHLFEQAVGLLYAIDVGADILYVKSRNPRVLMEAIREHRMTSMVVVPQVIELFWTAIEREVAKSGRAATFERTRRIARRLPYPARRFLFRSVHARLGGSLRLLVSAGAFLPPALQQAWEDLGIVVIQGYGSTESGFGTCTSREDHGLGTVGRTQPPIEVRLAPDGEIEFRGPSVFRGYFQDPVATAAASTPDGWYRSGDIGRFDEAGRLVLMGRSKDIIVLPNGLNVYPEDVENALRTAGIPDAVVLETRPGRIEAVLLVPGPHEPDTPVVNAAGELVGPRAVEARAACEAAVRQANARLAVHQRVAAWRPWPEADFPRTHTLKIRRDAVRAWATVDVPLGVRG